MSNQQTEIHRRSFLSLVGASAVSVGLAGCSESQEPDDGTAVDTENTNVAGPDTETARESENEFSLIVSQGQHPTTLDPHDHRETSTRSVLLQTYERILFRDREGEIVERLAADWERIDDGEVRFEIRGGVDFHDGKQLTAADCAYSILRVIDDDTHITSPQSGQLSGITDAEARSESDLRVYSDGFNPIVFANLATYCPILSEEWTEAREPNEVAQEANGTGPYRIANYEPDVTVDLEAFNGYWGDQPVVTSGSVRASSESSTRVNSLRAGEVDVITNVPPQDASTLESEAGTSITAVPSTRNLFLVLNDFYEPFDSREFRQALNYAIDMDSIIENVLNGFGDPTGQPTIEGTVGYAEDVEPYPYDPDLATQLVEQSGYSGAEFVIHTPVGRYLKDFEVAQAVAGFVNDLPNVSCDVQQRDFTSLIGEFTDGNQETSPKVFLIGSSNPSRDASQKFNSWLLPGAATSQVSDETFVEMYEQAQTERDPTRRAELLADINRRAHNEASLVFLHRQYSVYGLSDRVEWNPRQDELILFEEFRQA